MATIPGYNVPRSVVEEYIRRAFEAAGHDPSVANRVFRSEGAGNWQSQIRGPRGQEQSFGPFQLYTGGGEGNRFQNLTGLDPRDPNTWKQQVDYVANRVKETGWQPWHGAANTGIGRWEGINRGSVPAPDTSWAASIVKPESPVPSIAPPAGDPLSLSPLSTTASSNPLGSLSGMMQLAQLFGGLGGLGGSGASSGPAPAPAPMQPPPPLPPPPMAMQALAQMLQNPSYEQAQPQRRFYS